MKPVLHTFACLMLYASIASACPVCHTPTGQQVRAGIFDERFGENLLLTLAPFPALAAVVVAMHFGGRPRAGGRDER